MASKHTGTCSTIWGGGDLQGWDTGIWEYRMAGILEYWITGILKYWITGIRKELTENEWEDSNKACIAKGWDEEGRRGFLYDSNV